MSSTILKQAAARSAARQKKKTDPEPIPQDPRWITKKSPRGTVYRVITIPLEELGVFLEKNKLSPKMYFNYAGEGEVLGVRKDGETGDREL